MSLFDWAEELPHDWDAKPLRSVADYTVSNVDKLVSLGESPVRLCNYTDVYHNEYITLDLEFMSATASRHEIAKFGLSVDDVVITKDSESWDDICVPALVRETAADLVCGYHLALLRPRKEVMNGPFLFRCLQAKPVRLQLELAAKGVTRFGVAKADIGATMLPVPPLSQQRKITDFLDLETSRLDALVAEKECALELLAEKRHALIAHVVSRGMDPTVRFQKSGIPWASDIPEHWTIGRLKNFGTLVAGSGFPHEFQGIRGEMLPFYKVSDLAASRDGRHMEQSDNTISFETAATLRASVIPAGAVVYAKIGAALLLNRRRIATKPCVIDNNMTAYVPRREVISTEWALYWTSLLDFGMFSNPGAVPSLSEGDQGELPIPVPPMAEQDKITTFLDHSTSQMDGLMSEIRRALDLLKERRSSLIASAVISQMGQDKE